MLVLAVPVVEGGKTYFNANKKQYSLNCYSIPYKSTKMVSITLEKRNPTRSKTVASFFNTENLGMILFNDSSDVTDQPKILVSEGDKNIAFVYMEG